MFRQSSDFHEIMKSSYYPRLRKNAKKVPVSDCLFSFDIETTSWTENWSTMYSWAFGAAEYKDIVKCKCNQDLEYITLIKMGRTWRSFDEWLVKIYNISLQFRI